MQTVVALKDLESYQNSVSIRFRALTGRDVVGTDLDDLAKPARQGCD